MKASTIARWGCLVPVVGLLLLLFASYFATGRRTSEGKRLLPSTATDIEHLGFHGVIGGDHRGLTKARMPIEEYADYARSLGLTLQFDPKSHAEIETTLNMRVGNAPVWWDPPDVDGTTYFDSTKGRTYLRVLRYSEGHIYYLRLSW